MNTKISPGDVMFRGSYDHYFGVAKSALINIRCALELSQAPAPKRILDLPCGYGRVLRALRAEYPVAEIFACDIEGDGVQFCCEEFGAVPIRGHQDSSQIPLVGKFDLIWCGSLLTHLNSNRWRGFLARFADHLSKRGVLVFTTHGKRTVRHFRAGVMKYLPEDAVFEEVIHQYEELGFGYHDYKDVADYGISLARPSWVIREIESLPSLNLLLAHETGWDNHQDVFACTREE